ncbi:hypothetical protein EPUS_03511 [Endocarpon pusillum Z07020]|uniref:C2H2-domain containing protein second zinc finger domain-containing protein n=1 Tax=Endocarpon pusillum (strain Z07020 / HMAS-L-300199) TaxID=1263415 RepID=U1GHR5_ENDPU|nr:uncharacterized protein EPUS_03511 [Endocarpon pusillum Z07020]ERF71356.1 hypothetical protein EPUS_03511 [Endocarpon pusillum Z07020]
MPWTIWPALVVLWGVCWMFYEEPNRNSGDQDDIPTTSDTTGLFEGIDSIDPFRGDCPSFFLSTKALNTLPVFDSNISDISWDMSMWSEPQFNPQNLEQQLQIHVPEPVANCGMMTTLDSIPTSSAVDSIDTINSLVTNHEKSSEIVITPRFSSCQATSTIQESTENERLETVESGYHTPLSTFLVHKLAQDEQTISSQNSKHGQSEKHFCTYSDCNRSQPGAGFYRKDHLDQHLRGLHKQKLVPRIRVKSAAASSTCKLTTTSETTGAIVQSGKRKRESEGELSCHGGDGLFEELTKERRLRLLAEQENQRLHQKVENYEGRMQKYEERLDRMMALIEEHKGAKER